MTQETSLEVIGKVVEHPKSISGCELIVHEIRPIQITDDYPITKKEHGPDFLMKVSLWLRSRNQRAILQVKNEIIHALRQYF